MKFVFGVCECIGIILLWSGCGYLARKIREIDETIKDLDMAIARLSANMCSVDD